MFKKILIANRGEIAVRVMRACREMGIRTVAVYSEVDRASLHVRYADEAYPIGPAPSTESYLRIDRVLDAARRSGAEAIHPGYGFLAENPEFARACEESGGVFIGPPVTAMELMGSKTASRHVVMQAGLPVVPGADRNLESFDEVSRLAGEIGFPVMLKASAGGGGKGLRLVQAPAELESAYRTARSEAQNAFNDPSVYLEKYIEHPRHVEIQILGDQHGTLTYLGERECSLQRRHQKVMEECPSPAVDEDLRRRMGETAVRIGKLAGYWNAGTVEFLLDRNRNFYFLEMNTRLQVEHPVTELVVGIDLVKEQLRIAAGERLAWKQEDVRLRGVAIECRIYAEDPSNNFFPSPGLISRLQVPAGPGIRRDSGVYEGWRVPLEYDPLLSKLAVWATDRQEAIARMQRALGEYEILGVQTNVPFFRRILEHPDFIAGRIDTGFIDRALAAGLMIEEPPSTEEERIALLAAALHVERTRNSQPAVEAPASSAWKRAGREALLNAWPQRRRRNDH
ncbi:MAG: acetyl-CoA carboxylase biotin carboxylase subunit [Acidobacteriia bacterium]|nr:acetyl-CoA carboxylase biotin carboxylase subunit [Terriglobia bacterium]